MSCIYKIKEASSSFTTTEKKIAEYLLEHRDQAVQASAQELAEEIQTSAAALIRFSQRLGYKGFTALKVDLAKDVDDQIESIDLLINQEDSVEVMIKKAQKINQQTSLQTYKLINPNDLHDAIEILTRSETIFLCGIGGSGIVCTDFLQKLSRINRNVIYHEDSHVLMARIAHITENDALVAISYSGETNLVNTAISTAHQVGAKTIAISQYNLKSTLSKNADITLHTPIQEKELRLGAIASRNASLILTDLLYYGIAKSNLEQTKQDLVITRKLIHEIK